MVGLNYYTLLDRIPEALVILNPDDEIIFFNRKAREFEAAVRASFRNGVSFPELMTPEKRDLTRDILHRVKTRRQPEVIEAEYKDSRGGVSSVFETTYDPVVNPGNHVECVCVFFREKTVEKIFEKKSTQLQNDFTNLIEHANAFIFSIDSQSYITEWNQECEEVTQYSKGEVMARQLDTLIDDPRGEFGNFRQQIMSGHLITGFELYFRRKDGDIRIILVNATPRTNAAGAVVTTILVGHDITELSEYRKSLEEKIRDGTEKLKNALEKEKTLVELKNKFVSMASHEFRVPLSTIHSSVNAVRTNAKLRVQDKEKLSLIEKQIGHMRALIEDVLNAGKADAAKLKANHQKFELVGFLREVIRDVQGSYNSHAVAFEPPVRSLEIASDEKLLRNIFVNLLTNAIKFSPGKDRVDISMVVVAGKETSVTVTDHGIGIEPQDLEKIFIPFNRGSNTGAIKGTGLGMSIVKRAVEALKGTLAIESESGKGTRITVTLPLEPENIP